MCAVQVKLELGHRAQVRKKPTLEGFTHDWMVFVRGPDHSNIQHFVEKVVFHLHESFHRPKRVCKDPPYKVEESGYAGFILPIEVYFKNKGTVCSWHLLVYSQEEPKKVRFDYDLFLHLEGHPPVNHLRCEKLTFNNPTEEFRRKLLKAGGIMVMSEGTSFSSGTSLHLPSFPCNSLSFSDVKKSKSSHGSKDPNKLVSINNSISLSKPHKSSKEHKEKSSKDSKEHRSAFKEPSREHNKSSKESSKKPKENKPLKEEKIVPKMAFKEPKPMSKEPRCENNNILTVSTGHQQEKKLSSKRPPHLDSEDLFARKRKKSNSESSIKSFSNSSLLILSSSDKKPFRDKSVHKIGKVKIESEVMDRKKLSLPPFEDIVDPNDTDMEDNMSSKSESGQPSPASSSSSSSSSVAPPHNHRQGSLRSIVKDLHSDDNEDESDDAEDNDSENERPIRMHGGSRIRRISLSDGSNSESSSVSSPLRNEPPTLLKTNNQILEVKSPIKQSKSEKQIKNGDCDKAYLDELVELHRRLMTLRERHVLQQIVNLIEETGHFHITNTTFDFDLCSLDKTTVRKLQSYLETTGAS
ncbi:protein AF-9 isoform X2 [Xenopus laevis]|uniref:Protein AF-9 isoform X2 n=1 Tax=Xenopus laevis TaxID=8355 RepID=A0A8J0U9J7_XENLA|nr:protein AF-9 isoform X2 [Xenopus laevis]